jgi:hypothetical protein
MSQRGVDFEEPAARLWVAQRFSAVIALLPLLMSFRVGLKARRGTCFSHAALQLMWRQPPRLSAERSDAQQVWNGHSLRQAQGRLCPLPLTLTLMLTLTSKWGAPFLASFARSGIWDVPMVVSCHHSHTKVALHSIPCKCKKELDCEGVTAMLWPFSRNRRKYAHQPDSPTCEAC